MAYSAASRCAGLIPNILNGASDFTNLDAEVRPASTALVGFQSAGCAVINAHIAAMGYTATVASTHVLYDMLADIEANYVAYRAELARSSPRIAAGERTRADQFKKAFDAGIKDLKTMDLSMMGVSMQKLDWYIGGRSIAEKDSVESDTDRTSSRFGKGQFDGDGVVSPDGQAYDDQSED